MTAILILLALAGLIVFAIYSLTDEWFMAFLTCLVVLGIVAVPVFCMTGGLLPNYSQGVREGYVTKTSVKGVIWKTNEAQIQVGTGNMAALQEPFAFSVPDDDLFKLLKTYAGEKVIIEYRQWALMPYRMGETNYACVGVLPAND